MITDRLDRMLSRLDRYRAARAESKLLSRRIAGWHLEGPFLSPEPGFHGAHPQGTDGASHSGKDT